MKTTLLLVFVIVSVMTAAETADVATEKETA
jgi:hypothetical protein